MTVVIAVANTKGGASKSTSTCELGVSLALEGRRVCAIDLDKQCNLTYSFDGARVGEGESIGAALEGARPLEEIVVRDVEPRVDLLPGNPRDLLRAEVALASNPADGSYQLRWMLETFRDAYDVVIVDTPGNAGHLLVNSLLAATHVLIPMPAERDHVLGAQTVLEQIVAVRRAANPGLQVAGILVTAYERMTRATAVAEEMARELAALHGVAVFDTKVPRDTKIKEAQLALLPAVIAFPLSRAAIAYRDAARELLRRLELS